MYRMCCLNCPCKSTTPPQNYMKLMITHASYGSGLISGLWEVLGDLKVCGKDFALNGMDGQGEMVEETGLELLVKASSDGKGLGDCIQCHRLMMFLALKGVDAKVTTIDLVRKPLFFKENYSGMKLPCLSHELSEDKKVIIDDTAEIEDHLENQYPEPKLKFGRGENDGGASKAEGRIFQKFSAYVRNKDPNADEKLKGILLDELSRLDKFLGSESKLPGKFLAGETMMQPDCILLPKLYQLQVALKFYKDFEIPDVYENLYAYLNAAEEEEIFTGTRCDSDEVILFWSAHGDQKKAQQFLRTRSGSTSMHK